MTLNQFIDDNVGVPGIGDTPENRGQCVGLIEVWTDALGEPHTWGNAADLLTNADTSAFNIIYNGPDNFPAPGDVLCFNWPPYGHTGVVTRADANTFTLFEQNNPTGHAPRLHDYPNYSGVIGWLHSKVLDQTNAGGKEAMSPDQERQAYEIVLGREPEGPADGRTAWQFIQDARGELDAHRASDAMLVQQLRDATEQARTQQTEIDRLAGINKALTDANEELHRELGQKAPQAPVLPIPQTQVWVKTPESQSVQSQSSNSPQLPINNNVRSFSVSQYRKFIVAVVGAAVTVGGIALGVHNPVLVALVQLATALGVYGARNK